MDPDYVTYLKNIEKNKRGFTRVPNVIYNNERKMVCGIVLEIAESKSMGRKEFLRRQWVYCNLIIDEIREMANKTYQEVVNGNDKILQNASCDFKLLEKAADEYELKKGEPTCQNN